MVRYLTKINYEFNTSNDTHEHYHLICAKCGQIKDIKENFMTGISEKLLEKYHFIINGYNQRLYGICQDCLVKEEQIPEDISCSNR